MLTSNFQLSDELCDQFFHEVAASGMCWPRPVFCGPQLPSNHYGVASKIASVTSSPTITGSQVIAGKPSGGPASG